MHQQTQAEASVTVSREKKLFMGMVEGILTGISCNNYIKQLDLVKEIVNTTEELILFVDNFHSKAVDRQSDMLLFGKMCNHLSSMSVKNCDKSGELQQFCFKKGIINKCQKTFETWTLADDKEKLNFTQTFFGNILLAAELYKIGFLNTTVMMKIIQTLLEMNDDISIEGLCNLLTNIGKVLESCFTKQPKPKSEWKKYFMALEQIVKDSQRTSKVRSNIHKVLEMKNNNWMLSLSEITTEKLCAVQQTHKYKHHPYECGVCMSLYDEGDHRPRTLLCGHSYCSKCLGALIVEGSITCPACRIDHPATDASQFPVCYAIEDIMKTVKLQQNEASSVSLVDCEKSMLEESQTVRDKIKWKTNKGLSKKMRSLILEQRTSVENLQGNMKEELEQLKQYRSKLAEYKDTHNNIIEELNTLVSQNQSYIEMLTKEDMKVEGLLKDGEEAEKELQTACHKLDKVTEAQNAIACIDEADHIMVELEEWLQHNKEELPNCSALKSSFMMFCSVKPLLKVMTKDATSFSDEVPSGHSDCSIMEEIMNKIEGAPVKLPDLRDEKLQRCLKDGRVFAVQEYEDEMLSSQVKSEGTKVYVYYLNKKPPPPGSFTLQVESTLENLTCITSVFLDLKTPTSTTTPHSQKRISIKLISNSPLIKYFITLFLGHTGISYCNSMFEKVDRYLYRDIVWGPNISNHEAACHPSLPLIQDGHCVPNNNGMVVIRVTGNTLQFGIAIASNMGVNNHVPHIGYLVGNVDLDGQNFLHVPHIGYLVGNVDLDGQNFLQQVINSNQVSKIRVENCGIECY